MVCKHFDYELTEEDRYHINAPEFNNCMYCAIAVNGPMTYEQIAKYVGCTKMNVVYIERRAVRKINESENPIIVRSNILDQE